VARVVVDVMLKPEILDPAGQAVAGALPRLGVTDVASVRIGKRIEIDFTGQADLDRAREIADRLLANPVIETFTLRVEDGPEPAPSDPAAGVPTVHATLRELPAGTTLIEAKPVEPEGDPK
jgi:phosphoribosylformylglycinamidine synthase